MRIEDEILIEGVMKKLFPKRAKAEDAAIGGTSTANLPFNQLIAPSTPASRGDDKTEDEEETDDDSSEHQWADCTCSTPPKGDEQCTKCGGFVLGIVRRMSPLGEEMTLNQQSLPDEVIKIPMVQQTTHFCGPASLNAVLGYWGVNEPEERIAQLAGGTHTEGTSSQGLSQAARDLGFDAENFELSNLDTVKKYLQQKIPVIVFWWGHGRQGDGNHASVIVGAQNGFVYLMDPEVGMIVPQSEKRFLKSWFSFSGLPSKDTLSTGEILIVKPKKNE